MSRWIVVTALNGKRVALNSKRILAVVEEEFEGVATIKLNEGSKLTPKESYDEIMAMIEGDEDT